MNKKICLVCMILAMMLSFAACGIEVTLPPTENGSTQQTGMPEKAEKPVESENELGDYGLEILSCRLAKDYEDKDIVIVKYAFTNNSDDAASFMFAFEDAVFQNGIGLNETIFAADSAGYSSDNQTKEIQKGATLEVEVAYNLNDSETKIDVEVKELISFSDKKITKSFEIK